MRFQESPLAYLAPLLIAHGVAFFAAVSSVLVGLLRENLPERRLSTRRDLFRLEATWQSLLRTCFSEGFFMGNVGFSIWALTMPLEGQSYNPEVQVGAILLLLLSSALYPFMHAWGWRGKGAVLVSLLGLALYVLIRHRLC